ncbi:TatA/E family twin arginine-targeting protein translocase [Cyanobium sp. NS01]|uniref:TatA/E family twin arginine-targeting protein translocase n=1 Tax=Cyanobium sp. NS01 TaxID=261284 RepID=UPI0016475734|nr:TatA/E family twin arginine-targeting protein translocase [Cyanobium sp. NS01]QNI71773.1 twin arginine-targeting translocase/ TatA/E family protein [Cyanobium sp. NS01]
MNIFGIGLPEMAVIAAIGLLVFGPKRLPELGRTLGRTLKGFQSASSGFEQEFRTAINSFEASASEAPSAATPASPAQLSAPAASAESDSAQHNTPEPQTPEPGSAPGPGGI